MKYWDKLRQDFFLSGDLGVYEIKVQFVFHQVVIEVAVSRASVGSSRVIQHAKPFNCDCPTFIDGVDPHFVYPHNLTDIIVFLDIKLKTGESFGLSSEIIKRRAKTFLGSLERHRKGVLGSYPEFLPGYLSETGIYRNHSDVIFSDKRFVYLGGVPGVGRSCFVRSFLAWRHGLNLEKANKESFEEYLKDGKSVAVVVREIALVPLETQGELLKRYLLGETLLLGTQYDFAPLVDTGIIANEELVNLCRENQLMFFSDYTKVGSWDFFINVWAAMQPEKFSLYLSSMILAPRAKTMSQLSSFFLRYSYLVNFFMSNEERDLRKGIEDFEVFAIQYSASRVGRSQHKIADHLGISRGSLQHKIRKYKLDYKGF